MKRGSVLIEVVVHVVLIGIVLAAFLFAVAGRVNGRDVKQQVLEKQLALLIDSADSGMSFAVSVGNVNGVIDSVKIQNGRVFVGVDGFPDFKGYPYFSRYDVSVEKVQDKFIVRVGK